MHIIFLYGKAASNPGYIQVQAQVGIVHFQRRVALLSSARRLAGSRYKWLHPLASPVAA
jgi:hypothetical protein